MAEIRRQNLKRQEGKVNITDQSYATDEQAYSATRSNLSHISQHSLSSNSSLNEDPSLSDPDTSHTSPESTFGTSNVPNVVYTPKQSNENESVDGTTML